MSAADDFMERVLAILGGGNAGSPIEWAARMLTGLDAPFRLALARALVADMPGVVVAQVPDAWLVPAEKNTPYNKGRRRGWNDFRTELISNGSAADGR